MRLLAAIAAAVLLGMAAAAQEPAEWASVGHGSHEQHYSPLDQINVDNVGRLGLAWYADLKTDRGQEATPLVVDGVLYNAEPERHLRIVPPQLAPGRGVVGGDDVPRLGVVEHAAGYQRRRFLPAVGLEVGVPGEAELADVAIVDASGRTVALLGATLAAGGRPLDLLADYDPDNRDRSTGLGKRGRRERAD